MTANYPHGGPLGLPSEIAAIFIEHVRSVCERSHSPDERKAQESRDSMIAGLSAEHRRLLVALAKGVISTAQRIAP